MKISKRRKAVFLFFMTFILMILIYCFTLPVKIYAIHQDENFSSLLVKNFPLSDNGKLAWWLENNKFLAEKYDLPVVGKNGTYSVSFWAFDGNYKKMPKSDLRLSSEDSDLLCFDDIKSEKKCISKKLLFTVSRDREGNIYFTVYNGTYLQRSGGEIVKIE
ncbi:DUF943 family protein [Erwinia oleae]|uniref:DUF943 family protein n=1 Tax=Erwinia oleae TaxID=796334 RepID=UPI0005596A0B|nr:DUF943 family protein [Erwinia oleae]